MSAIPSKLVMLRTLANVPVSEYADIRPPTNVQNSNERLGFLKKLRQKPNATKTHAPKKMYLSFNAAVWMTFNKTMQKPVSLWLSYKDQSGENTILVDEQYLNDSTSAMLSGSVSINVKGHLEYLRASCGGVTMEDRYSIDEVYVRRQDVVMNNANSYAGMVAS